MFDDKLQQMFIFQIILNSMHRFQPRIYLVVRPEGANQPITDIEKEKYRTYIFPETIFTAVTAYQNQLVSSNFIIINLASISVLSNERWEQKRIVKT